VQSLRDRVLEVETVSKNCLLAATDLHARTSSHLESVENQARGFANLPITRSEVAKLAVDSSVLACAEMKYDICNGLGTQLAGSVAHKLDDDFTQKVAIATARVLESKIDMAVTRAVTAAIAFEAQRVREGRAVTTPDAMEIEAE